MPEEVVTFLKGIDFFEVSIVFGIFIYIVRTTLKTIFPSVAALNEILESIKDLPVDIPRMKEELQSLKSKVTNIERRLESLVDSGLLPRESDLIDD